MSREVVRDSEDEDHSADEFVDAVDGTWSPDHSGGTSAVARDFLSTEAVLHIHPEVLLGRQVMRCIFQARFDQAEELLQRPPQHPTNSNSTNSALLSSGESFVWFTQALVSFEPSKITQALNLWKQTEKLCNASKNDPLEERLEQRVILADAKICSTFLQLLQSADFGGLFKGGWALRQAWKLYQTAYDDTVKLVQSQHQHGALTLAEMSSLLSGLPLQGSSMPQHVISSVNGVASASGTAAAATSSSAKVSVTSSSGSSAVLPGPGQISSTNNGVNGASTSVQYARLHQLLGSVCYGYGCFHLMLSLLPGNLMKWLQFLGFHGDMQLGMQALTYSMNSPDSKSLLARVTLVWFHTIIQTYYAVQEHQLEEGIESALRLLDGMDDELRSSPLIQFFDCRLKRFKKDIDGALDSYGHMITSSAHLKDINILVHHEVGILRFHLQHWTIATQHLTRCLDEGRWGKCLYAYLLGICYSLLKDEKKGRDLILQGSTLNRIKNAPLEMFVADRAARLAKEQVMFRSVCLLLALEMIYFLNCPHFLPLALVNTMLRDLAEMKNAVYLPLRFLMEGQLRQALDQNDQAIQCYKEAVTRGDETNVGKTSQLTSCGEHVPAFASYEAGVLLSQKAATRQEGEEFLQKASVSYKNCHFRNRLHVRIHLARKSFG